MKNLLFFIFYYALGITLLIKYGQYINVNSGYGVTCVGCEFITKTELSKWTYEYFLTLPGFLVGVLWPLYFIGLFIIMVSS